MNNSDMERILKRIAFFTGFAVLAISIYFSYDGFDQSVSGSNENYTTLAIVIGITLSIVGSVIQFIFGTAYKDLNWTLRIVGVAAYVYSIYTNYLGIKHVLGTTEFMAWASALFMDIYPEPAIAWALGEALTGDLFGNLGKMVFGGKNKTTQQYDYQTKSQSPVTPILEKPNGEERKHRVKPPLASPMFNDRYTNRFKTKR